MYRVFIVFIAALLMTSCMSVNKLVEFEVLKPSEITVPKDVKTVAFVYRNTLTKVDTAYLSQLENKDLEMEMFGRIVDICYQGFHDVVVPTKRFLDIAYYKTAEIEVVDSEEAIPLLTWDTVNSICKKLKADILVVLEYSRFKLSDNETRPILMWNYKFRTYDPLYEKIIDKEEYADTVDYTNILDFEQYEDPIGFEIDRLSYTIGSMYAKRINPYWAEVSRKFYRTGDKYLAAGTYYFDNSRMNTAIKVWEEVLKGDKPQKSAKACINIALAYEMGGDMVNAKKYASLSLYYYKQFKAKKDDIEYAKALIKSLQKREIEMKILKEQI